MATKVFVCKHCNAGYLLQVEKSKQGCNNCAGSPLSQLEDWEEFECPQCHTKYDVLSIQLMGKGTPEHPPILSEGIVICKRDKTPLKWIPFDDNEGILSQTFTQDEEAWSEIYQRDFEEQMLKEQELERAIIQAIQAKGQTYTPTSRSPKFSLNVLNSSNVSEITTSAKDRREQRLQQSIQDKEIIKEQEKQKEVLLKPDLHEEAKPITLIPKPISEIPAIKPIEIKKTQEIAILGASIGSIAESIPKPTEIILPLSQEKEELKTQPSELTQITPNEIIQPKEVENAVQHSPPEESYKNISLEELESHLLQKSKTMPLELMQEEPPTKAGSAVTPKFVKGAAPDAKPGTSAFRPPSISKIKENPQSKPADHNSPQWLPSMSDNKPSTQENIFPAKLPLTPNPTEKSVTTSIPKIEVIENKSESVITPIQPIESVQTLQPEVVSPKLSLENTQSDVSTEVVPILKPILPIKETIYANAFWEEYYIKKQIKNPQQFIGGKDAPAKIRGLLEEVNQFILDPAICEISRPMIDTLESGKIYYIGDTHGSIEDTDLIIRFFVKEIENAKKTNSQLRIIFLGDYVDRHPMDIHNLLYILSFAVRNADYVRILRGNHEEVTINSNYGFRKNVDGGLKDAELFIDIEEVFANIPLVHVTQTSHGAIVGLHGGLPIIETDTSQMPGIPTLIKGKDEIDSCYLYINEMDDFAQQILWNDPAIDLPPDAFYLPSPRGIGFHFGEKVFNAWCEVNKIDRVVRGHEVYLSGHQEFFENRLFSIFSSSNYVGRKIKAKILEFDLSKPWDTNWDLIEIQKDIPSRIA